uniref:N-acetyltransferase domain-containing protein n=1 Tax=Eucampia antarctica TaxID=49252 RepID=A0A7S2SDJ9_9STRA
MEWCTYNRYVKTARKLKGMKHTIFLAKHSQSDEVLGMVEVGMTVRPPNGIVVPTMGVLCVDPDFQRCGIGTLLVHETEHLVQNVWNLTTSVTTTSIHVEIETDNPNSLAFFKSRGYAIEEDDENNVNVLEKGIIVEKKPCWVVTKPIQDISSEV